jgi:serine/threonine-protein kinase HipA
MKRGPLVILLNGQVAGQLIQTTGKKLVLRYADEWREAAEAYPISLSMPLTAAEHAHVQVNAYIWGLLPENPLVLDRWARQFQVSPADAFALLSHVGEDCPGAVQFVSQERAEELLVPHGQEVAWLSAKEIADRLRQLRVDHAAWRSPGDSGQFSLAGAQPKTALLYDGRRYGIPSGRTPTTHILKPPQPDLDGHAENEHLCLGLARALGLPSASSSVQHFEDQVAIVVERYDRHRTGRHWHRVHQEDMCQALSISPSSKYQSEGGPSGAQIVELLRTYSSRHNDDVRTFTDALIFNWLIAGTDAHAKNYSLLLGEHGRVRLAPLYDIASAYAYPRLQVQKLKLAMKIGSKYRVHDISRRSWQGFAKLTGIDEDELLDRARAMAAAIPDEYATLRKQAASDGIKHPALVRLQTTLTQQIGHCAARLTQATG